MPYCCVPKCTNSWKKKCSMHCLPRNIERKKQWIANIGRCDLDFLKTYFICEVSFIILCKNYINKLYYKHNFNSIYVRVIYQICDL